MKRIVLALSLVCSVVAAKAQDTRLGIKLSGGIAKYRGSGTSNQTNQLSAGGGVMANVKLTDMFSVQPELLYTVKGSRNNNDNFDSKTKLNYIELPVLLRATFGGAFIEAGPQAAYLITANQKIEGKNGTASSENKSRTGYSEADWGFAGGVGYQLANGLSLTGRYSTGVHPILPNVNGQRVKAYNSGFLIQLGYLFPAGE